jgi:hypothetical protein
MFQLLELQDLVVLLKTNQLVWFILVVKKGKTVLIKENKFKSKNRNSIQKSTVRKVIKIVLNLI